MITTSLAQTSHGMRNFSRSDPDCFFNVSPYFQDWETIPGRSNLPKTIRLVSGSWGCPFMYAFPQAQRRLSSIVLLYLQWALIVYPWTTLTLSHPFLERYFLSLLCSWPLWSSHCSHDTSSETTWLAIFSEVDLLYMYLPITNFIFPCKNFQHLRMHCLLLLASIYK